MELEINTEDLLTKDGCVKILDALREWMRNNIPAAHAEAMENATDEMSRVGQENSIWQRHKEDPMFLMGTSFGIELLGNALMATDLAVIGVIPVSALDRRVIALTLSVVKQRLTLET